MECSSFWTRAVGSQVTTVPVSAPRWVFVEHGLRSSEMQRPVPELSPWPSPGPFPVGSCWPLCFPWAGDTAEKLQAEALAGQIRSGSFFRSTSSQRPELEPRGWSALTGDGESRAFRLKTRNWRGCSGRVGSGEFRACARASAWSRGMSGARKQRHRPRRPSAAPRVSLEAGDSGRCCPKGRMLPCRA